MSLAVEILLGTLENCSFKLNVLASSFKLVSLLIAWFSDCPMHRVNTNLNGKLMASPSEQP